MGKYSPYITRGHGVTIVTFPYRPDRPLKEVNDLTTILKYAVSAYGFLLPTDPDRRYSLTDLANAIRAHYDLATPGNAFVYAALLKIEHEQEALE